MLELNGMRLAFTTDSYVVKPIFFPGGDIGDLAVNGTVNDLAVAGARPLALSAGFVIEEGFRPPTSAGSQPRWHARRRRRASPSRPATPRWSSAARRTASTSRRPASVSSSPGIELGPDRVRPGDRVLVSGPIGDHGMAVMVARGELQLEVDLQSDTASVLELAQALLTLGGGVRFMRDPTRGGVATALNELAQASGTAVQLDEAALPVRSAVVGTCEILGIDPLYVACEGRLLAVVAAEDCDAALALLRGHPLGAEAAVIGEVRAEPEGLVLLDTSFGGSRVVDMLVGDPLPRIC